MPCAARLGDPTAHGGTLVTGFPTVLIGGMPSARMGDMHVCPMLTGVVPHVGGPVTLASMTVIIGGAFAARQGDLTMCMGAGTPGVGVPGVVGPATPITTNPRGLTIDQLDGANPSRELYADGELTDSDGDGTRDTVRGETGVHRVREQRADPNHDNIFNWRASEDGGYARGSARASEGGPGDFGLQAGAEAGVYKESFEVSVGPAGDEGRNPYLAIGYEYDIGHAEARGDLLLGDDGRRVGVGAVGKAGAEAAGGKVTARVTTPSIFGINLQARGEAGGTVLATPGGGLGGWVYWDRQESRFHIGALGELAALVGVELNLDISIGAAYAPPAGGPGAGGGALPDPIAMGCPTVMIGG